MPRAAGVVVRTGAQTAASDAAAAADDPPAVSHEGGASVAPPVPEALREVSHEGGASVAPPVPDPLREVSHEGGASVAPPVPDPLGGVSQEDGFMVARPVPLRGVSFASGSRSRSGPSSNGDSSEGNMSSGVAFSNYSGSERGRLSLKSSRQRAVEVKRLAAIANSSILLDRVTLQGVVRKESQQFNGCLTLIFNLLYFVFYTIAATLFTDTPRIHLLEAPLRLALKSPLEAVGTIAEAWSWIDGTFVPLFFRQADAFGEPLPQSEWSRLFFYSQLVGTVVLEQQRSIRQVCPHDISAHMQCHPERELSRAPFGRPLSDLPASFNRSVISSDSEGFSVGHRVRRLRLRREEIGRWMNDGDAASEDDIFKFYLKRTSPIVEIRQRTDYLRLRGWLDDQTTHLKIQALVLNAEAYAPRLARVQADMAFSRGGGIFSTLNVDTLWLRSAVKTPQKLFSVCFLIFMLSDSCAALWRLVRACRRRKAAVHLCSSANLLIHVNILLAWLLLIGYLVFSGQVADLNSELNDVTALDPSGPEFQAAVDEAHAVMDSTVGFEGWYHDLVTGFTIVLMIRCFVSLQCQPRLSVFVNTLKATSVDLFHFVIIFIPTLVAFAIAGMYLFGRRVEDFSSLDRAIGTCFKISIEYEFSWQELSAEEFWTAASWVFAFVLLVCLIMMNMVLVIIMDVYSEVRSGTASNEALWDTWRYTVTRLRMYRHWVPDEVLLEQLELMPTVITDTELKAAFPEMRSCQLSRLSFMARAHTRAAMMEEARSSLPYDLVAAIKTGVDRVTELTAGVYEMRLKTLQETPRSDDACMEDIMQSIAVQDQWMTFLQSQLDSLCEQMQSCGVLEGSSSGGDDMDEGMPSE